MFEFIKDYLHLCIVGWPFGVGHLIAIYLIAHGWVAVGVFFLITIMAVTAEIILKAYLRNE
ncbi:MAG: hypothetical protein CL760_11985 [Chloroflexi bacterium]|nr:hypothetical protein [Chloroflexota bacterium]|tara:strand:- start:36667 stop:36849 length:183 start_codon:yes stop_codon:yes gene_type:complete